MLLVATTFLGLAWQDALVVLLYLAAMLAIGVWFKWREAHRNTEDYLLGGRGMPWWLIGIAYVMTLLSTNSLVAVPGEAFNHGLSLALRYFLAPIVGVAIFISSFASFSAAGCSRRSHTSKSGSTVACAPSAAFSICACACSISRSCCSPPPSC